MYRQFGIILFTVTLSSPGYVLGQSDPPLKKLRHFEHRSWSANDTPGAPGIVNAITQTPDGYLWIGTGNDVSRFDGRQFLSHNHKLQRSTFALDVSRVGILWVGAGPAVYRVVGNEHQSGISALNYREPINLSKSKSQILAISNSRNGNTWIATSDGLTMMGVSDTLIFSMDTGLPDKVVYAVLAGRNDMVWAGTGNGLVQIENRRVIDVISDPINPKSNVLALLQDRNGNLWVGTESGLYIVGATTPTSQGKLQLQRIEDPRGILAQGVLSLVETQDGTLWIGTAGNGIVRMLGSQYDYLNEDSNFSGSEVKALFEDREGNVWVGTNGSGLHQFRDAPLTLFTEADGLPAKSTTGILTDSNGDVWIGSNCGGISRFDIDHFTTFGEERGLSNGCVFGISEATGGGLWVGTWGGGLSKFLDGEFTTVYNESTQTSDVALGATYDSQDGLWIRSNSSTFRVHNGQVTNFPETGYLLSTSRSELWLGGPNGLKRFDGDAFQVYLPQYTSQTDVSADTLDGQYIFSLLEDSQQTLWAAPMQGGLYRIKNDSIFAFGIEHGVPSGALGGRLIEGDDGRIWFAGETGICGILVSELSDIQRGVLDRVTPDCMDIHDGMASGEFQVGLQFTADKDHLGRMWFDMIDGVVMFDPRNRKKNVVPPPVVVTRVFVDDQEYTSAESMRLTPGQYRFRFVFEALSFSVPEKNKFRYRLNGYDKDWIDAGTAHEVVYTGVGGGVYEFEVTASNNDGVWNESGSAFMFRVEPALYERPLFPFILFLGLTGTFFVIYRWRLKVHKTRANYFEQLVDSRTIEIATQRDQLEHQKKHLLKLDDTKNRFFDNVSHEFRTPLTLIVGPMEDLRDGLHGTLSQEQREQIDLSLKNTHRVQRLIDEILDISKLEAGGFELVVSEGNLLRNVEHVCNSFQHVAKKLSIDIAIESEKPVIAWYDAEQMERIVSNILSNAIKFSPPDSTVRIQVFTENRTARIAISDCGPGIPEHELQHVFDRFYQSGESLRSFQVGSGIGLSLSNELARLHHGNIHVTNEIETGATFTVSIPLGNNHLNQERIKKGREVPYRSADAWDTVQTSANSRLRSDYLTNTFVGAKVADDLTSNQSASEQLPTILVIDDNSELRSFLRKHLANYFRIIEAESAEIGLGLALAETPDVIVSDVMMPGMDGEELLRELRNNVETDFIPVILLTARAGTKGKLAGLKAGADGYLTKPFSVRELTLRIQNVIESRRRLCILWTRTKTTRTTLYTGVGSDDKFLNNLHQIIDTNLHDEDFSVARLAVELGQSRATLHRKVRSIIDQAPAEIIKTARLDRAAEMLVNDAGNVSEIAYGTGFRSVSYFCKCFKDRFSTTPTKYAINHSN